MRWRADLRVRQVIREDPVCRGRIRTTRRSSLQKGRQGALSVAMEGRPLSRPRDAEVLQAPLQGGAWEVVDGHSQSAAQRVINALLVESDGHRLQFVKNIHRRAPCGQRPEIVRRGATAQRVSNGSLRRPGDLPAFRHPAGLTIEGRDGIGKRKKTAVGGAVRARGGVAGSVVPTLRGGGGMAFRGVRSHAGGLGGSSAAGCAAVGGGGTAPPPGSPAPSRARPSAG